MIHYIVDAQLDLIGFTDSEWDRDGNDRKSTPGFVFMLGSGPICGPVRSKHLLQSLQQKHSIGGYECNYSSSLAAWNLDRVWDSHFNFNRHLL